MTSRSVNVRFAPSPTGFLHIGGARTALFNFLFARCQKGKFLLRIEDTDLARSRSEMTQGILRSLQWLGLEWDEEPVFQAENIRRHREVCHQLWRSGAAYPCFCTPESLKIKRETVQKVKGEYQYDRTCLKLSTEQVEENSNQGLAYAIRFHVPEGQTQFEDLVRGSVIVQNREIDDFIILRSNDSPVYQIAVVVDDHDMEITHVIRGDDHLSNTPKQILIYQALGWRIPAFAHVPMILGSDKKRLSKRHGAISVEEYQSLGYIPQAVVNFLTLLGWSPGEDREILTLEELIQEFSLERISKNPAVFDETKLAWMNGQYISLMTDQQLLVALSDLFRKEGWLQTESEQAQKDYILRIIHILKNRTRKLTDFVLWGRYFFEDPESYDITAVQKHWKDRSVISIFQKAIDRLEPITSWSENQLETVIRYLAEQDGVSAGKWIHPIRLALTGFGVSPGLFELMEILGKERVLRRLDKAVCYLNK